MSNVPSRPRRRDRRALAFSGPNLKAALKAKGITKWRLAKDLGISYRAVQYWERSEAAPSPASIEALEAYFGQLAPERDVYSSIVALQDQVRQLSAEVATIKTQLGIEGTK